MTTISASFRKTNKAKNSVLSTDYRPSENFYESDKVFAHHLQKKVSTDGKSYMEDKLQTLGKRLAVEMDDLSLKADKNGPVLVKRSKWGEDINEIEFHPAYWKLRDIAVESEMFRVKWEPELRNKFKAELHSMGFAAGYLFAMGEGGLYCPLCMTDGVARLIDKFCSDEDKERLLPKIATSKPEELFTGAMYLTEKAGGSDVGANLVEAEKLEGDLYALNGEKWFCSNANADIIFALARTDESVKGTRGLSIFLVEKYLKDGTKNPIDIIRLKDKLGVRSMASAECYLTDTVGKIVGNEFEGFKVMTEMINLSRVYNAIAALSCSRRGLIEAYQFLSYRSTFGKNALDHALVRIKLEEIGSLQVASFYLVWRTIEALDKADNGNEKEGQLLRLLTPMTKKWSAEKGVYIIREAMELMGGMGYIEDGVVPKVMRDAMVLPIWEGAGNIMTLDMLRALYKSEGYLVMMAEIEQAATKSELYHAIVSSKMQELNEITKSFHELPQSEVEATAKVFFEHLTNLYQMAILVLERDETSKQWIDPALHYLSNIHNNELKVTKPLTREEIEGLIAWEI